MPAGVGLHSALLSSLSEKTCFTAEPAAEPAADPAAAPAAEPDPDEPPDDPIAGGEANGKGENAMEYPITGIINDIHSKTYLVDPSYWVSWGRVENPGFPTLTGITAPPAVWWQQRERWHSTWPRLSHGQEGIGIPWKPRFPPRPKKETTTGPFGIGTNKWWDWLDGRERPSMIPKKKGALPEEPKDLVQSKECPDFFENELYGKKEPVPGCFCPGPNCVYKDKGFFGGVAPEQLAWVNTNMMRRQTLPGRSDVLSMKAGSLRHASVRLERNQGGSGDEAATLDPRPPQPVENVMMPGMTAASMPKLKPYEAEGTAAALAKMAGGTAMEGLVGGSMIEQKAYMRLLNEKPEWLPNLIKSQRAKHLYETNQQEAAHELMNGGKEHKEEAVVKKRAKKRGNKALMEKPPEPEWMAPPPQRFEDLYEMKYRKFWPAMEVMARRQGSGPAQLIDELGQEWRSARVVPPTRPNAIHEISESAGADIRAARAALGGAIDRDAEDIIEAADQVLPVPQPQILQARPNDLSNIPSPVPIVRAKAYLAKDAPPQKDEAMSSSLTMYPAGHDGSGVQAKVPDSVVSMLNPEVPGLPQESAIGLGMATVGAVCPQLLSQEAHLARWRSAQPRGRRKLTADAAVFL